MVSWGMHRSASAWAGRSRSTGTNPTARLPHASRSIIVLPDFCVSLSERDPAQSLEPNAALQARGAAAATQERSNCLGCQGGLVYFFSFAPPAVARVSDVSA